MHNLKIVFFINFFFVVVAYHCELNPIELIWAQLKLFVRRRNTTGKIKDVYNLVLEAIKSITPAAWKKCVDHVLKYEEYFRQKDSEMQNFEAEGYEDVEFGALDEVIAGEVAAAQYKNPSSKLSHYFSCLFTFNTQVFVAFANKIGTGDKSIKS